MTGRRTRASTHRGVTPLWLLLALVAPIGLVVFTSLILALALAGVAAMLAGVALPAFRRRSRADSGHTIELDASQYHRIESRAADKED